MPITKVAQRGMLIEIIWIADVDDESHITHFPGSATREEILAYVTEQEQAYQNVKTKVAELSTMVKI